MWPWCAKQKQLPEDFKCEIWILQSYNYNNTKCLTNKWIINKWMNEWKVVLKIYRSLLHISHYILWPYDINRWKQIAKLYIDWSFAKILCYIKMPK
jgi:hypothetical protein